MTGHCSAQDDGQTHDERFTDRAGAGLGHQHVRCQHPFVDVIHESHHAYGERPWARYELMPCLLIMPRDHCQLGLCAAVDEGLHEMGKGAHAIGAAEKEHHRAVRAQAQSFAGSDRILACRVDEVGVYR